MMGGGGGGCLGYKSSPAVAGGSAGAKCRTGGAAPCFPLPSSCVSSFSAAKCLLQRGLAPHSAQRQDRAGRCLCPGRATRALVLKSLSPIDVEIP